MTTEPSGRGLAAQVASPVGSRRVEETLRHMTAVFGLLFTLQTVPLLVTGWPEAGSPLGLAIVVAMGGVVLTAALAVVLHQWTKPVFIAGALTYLVALAAWPASVVGPWPPEQMPWLLAAAGVPCGLMVVATRGALPVVYLVVTAAAVGLLRTLPSGGSLTPVGAARDGAVVLLLGLALLFVVAVIRRAARNVDDAQGTALGSYANAQIDEAIESERVRTDALVHDSVLTTFLSAAAAGTPEGRSLAARMAQNAMTVLSRATVASHVGPKVAVEGLLDQVKRDAAGVGDRFEFRMQRVRDHFLPDAVADAVVSATVQAMTNSVKHAGGPEVPRTVVVEGVEGGGVRVAIADRGRGFDLSAVASERLGLRVSIMERMRRVGGEVALTTAPGEGTEFVLSWPAASHPGVEVAERGEAVPA
ncbi:sensor histidine kinase [Amnibacterium endophyticum]|uniref:Sensor histidine kinase n=1 Tax=Amnibacterium endophyticum TaxID=2109337 RepID=A0ABW4LFD7_9MICO